VRQASVRSKLTNQAQYGFGPNMAQENVARAAKAEAEGRPADKLPLARVQTFIATVVLTPRLSVGTASPESIYEARFTGKIRAVSPRPESGECELELPLPPQVISLADLTIMAGDKSSEMVALRDGKLVWRGALAAGPTLLEVAYTAVGKGLYELSVPPGGILDQFDVSMEAKGRTCGCWSCPSSRRDWPARPARPRTRGPTSGCCSASPSASMSWGSRRSIGLAN